MIVVPSYLISVQHQHCDQSPSFGFQDINSFLIITLLHSGSSPGSVGVLFLSLPLMCRCLSSLLNIILAQGNTIYCMASNLLMFWPCLNIFVQSSRPVNPVAAGQLCSMFHRHLNSIVFEPKVSGSIGQVKANFSIYKEPAEVTHVLWQSQPG